MAKQWSEADDDIIRTYYPAVGSDMAALLSEPRMPHSIHRRARNLGVKCLKVKKAFWVKRKK